MTAAKLFAAAAAALALAGCGSGGGGEVGGQGGDGGSEQGAAYQAAFEFCKPGVDAVAAQWGTEATPEAVTEVIVDMVVANDEDVPEARRGCRAALREAETGP